MPRSAKRRSAEARQDSAVLKVRIQPRSSGNEIVRMEGGGIKIRLTAPPVDNAANEALIEFLADKLSVAKCRIEIISGHASREKTIRIAGISDEDVLGQLNIRD